jgi:SAM-dependent methyltransferase
MDTEGPCADPDNPELLGSWAALDTAMDKLFAPSFRARCSDAHGNPMRFGWFFLSWTGFTTNPRRRAFGYHAVRDHYLERWGDAIATYGDEQCWHYHHPPASGVANEWGLNWTEGDEYAQIVSRQVLERGWFPTCFRAGGTIVDDISSRWIDAWFPFDYSNRAPLAVDGLVDWSAGVASWRPYHPHSEDFRRPGSSRRRLFRCLDLQTNVYELGEQDVEQAFSDAREGHATVLACFDHDYRDIAPRLEHLHELVTSVAARTPEVSWRYAAPVEAARAALGMVRPRRLELDAARVGADLHVWSSEPLFQSVPWLAVETAAGDVSHVDDGWLRVDESRWVWRGDREWARAGLAGCTDAGEAAVALVGADDGPGDLFLRERTRVHPTRPRSIWEYSKQYVRSAVDRSAGHEPELDSAAQARTLLAARLQAGDSVLDVGCGAAHLYRSLRELGVDYYGIDSFRRGIEIGRLSLATGLPAERLRALAVEDLPPDERYTAVVSLSTLLYAPDFRLSLEAMARAAERLLLVRSSFGDETTVRYLADVILEPGFEETRAYFSIFSRAEVESFLADEGFAVEWVEDRRQRERFGGEPEVVAGIPLPYEFLVAERQ